MTTISKLHVAVAILINFELRSPYKHIWTGILIKFEASEWNRKAQSLFPPPDLDELFGLALFIRQFLALVVISLEVWSAPTLPTSILKIRMGERRYPGLPR